MQEVSLAQSPLVRVLAQVRFPTILAVHESDSVAGFQEQLRTVYPYLQREQVSSINLTAERKPTVEQSVIWRLVDREPAPNWRVSLGVNFVALDTSTYESREHFLDRFVEVIGAVQSALRPAEASRLGLRYIDRLVGPAIDQLGQLIQPDALGVLHPTSGPSHALGNSLVHLLTEAEFLAEDGACMRGRWGKLPINTTHDPDALEPAAEPGWVMDLEASLKNPYRDSGV